MRTRYVVEAPQFRDIVPNAIIFHSRHLFIKKTFVFDDERLVFLRVVGLGLGFCQSGMLVQHVDTVD